MGDRLRPLWDFGDLDLSEQRFRAQLEQETTDAGRAEVLTQLARVEGLRGRFEDGERLVDEAEALAGASVAARARVQLERGRLFRSGGRVEESLPLFEQAFAIAHEGGEEFLAVDAAHMAALAADREGMLDWTERGAELARASTDRRVRYWIGPLLNNLGWFDYEEGEYDLALNAFQGALRAREDDPERPREIQIAKYAVAKTLRALGRADEAVELLEQAVEWAAGAGEPDGWFHEELAEDYAALGREDEARAQAELALRLLHQQDPSLEENAERLTRLRALAGGSA